MIQLSTRRDFINQLKSAIGKREGFSAGKLGFSEQALLSYCLITSDAPSIQKRAFLAALKHHCDYITGVFPSTPEFLPYFTSWYLTQIQQANILGLMGAKREEKIITNLNIHSQFTHYQTMEPDRSIPEITNNCYLPLFENKKILLISPYAKFIQSRAQKEVYENAWKIIGKSWFNPANVMSLEIPYSYFSAKQTHEKFGDSITLYKSICDQINCYEYDVALIGAGALGIPIANHIKHQGKVGISLGGHLQVTFGVAGARWRRDPEWRAYLNETWVDVPKIYHPFSKESLTDHGAYW